MSGARKPATRRTLKGRGLTWKQLREMAGGAQEYIVMCLSVEQAKRVQSFLYPWLDAQTFGTGPSRVGFSGILNEKNRRAARKLLAEATRKAARRG